MATATKGLVGSVEIFLSLIAGSTSSKSLLLMLILVLIELHENKLQLAEQTICRVLIKLYKVVSSLAVSNSQTLKLHVKAIKCGRITIY